MCGPREECYVCTRHPWLKRCSLSPCVCKTMFVCNKCLIILTQPRVDGAAPRCTVCNSEYVCPVIWGVRWRFKWWTVPRDWVSGWTLQGCAVGLLLLFMFSVLAFVVGSLCFVMVHGPYAVYYQNGTITNSTGGSGVRVSMGLSFFYGAVLLVCVFIVTLGCTLCCVGGSILSCGRRVSVSPV
jgi:hypothetical protein